MIPYFRFTVIPIGPVNIQVWGLLVATGIVAAVLVGRKVALRRGLDPEVFTDLASWILVAAFIGARLLHAAAYEPAAFLADPLKIFRVWEGGLSSFGGFIGAAAGAALYVRKTRIRFLSYADVIAYVLPLGYGIGRIGCFLIHDHPGTLSHSFIAVRYPGGARLDHGLLLSMLGFAIFACFFLRERRPRAATEGGYLFFFMLFYGLARFVLDFFRAWDLPGADVRYYQLTPAQYGCLLLVAGGAWGLKTYVYGRKTLQGQGAA